jgi:hypothetical protein
MNQKPLPKQQQPLDYALSVFALTVSAIVWLIVFTFPDFYFFNPLDAPTALRRVALTLSTIGWISQATVPTILILLYASGRRGAIEWLWIGALLWPATLLFSQVTNYMENEAWFGNYLTDYPVFGFTDIALPLVLMYLWTRLRTLPRE